MKALFRACAAFMLSTTPLFADVAEAEIAACQAAPTSECLADIGVALAMVQEKLSTKREGVKILAQLGRFNDADALTFRTYRLNGWSPKAARIEADHHMAAFRVQEALLAGEGFETATKGASQETVHKALMQIAGQSILIRFKSTQNPHSLAIVTEFTNRPELSRKQRVFAAGILSRLGKPDLAKRLFLTVVNEPGDPPYFPSGMIKLIGTHTALEIFQRHGDIGFYGYKQLARAETDPIRAVAFLHSAFDIAKAKPDATYSYPDMVSVIQLAAELGHLKFAQEATAAFQTVLKNANDTTISGNMMLARSLLAIKAPAPDIRALLNTVRNGLSDRSMSDPHGHFSQELGQRYAQLGDVEAAVTAIAASNDPIRSWQITLRSDLPPGVFDALFQAAHKTLTPAELAQVKKWTALSLSLAKRTEVEHQIASKAAWDILDQPPQSDANARIWFYTSLLMIAHRLEDTALTKAVRPRLAAYALQTRAYLPLLQAAHLTYQIEQSDTH